MLYSAAGLSRLWEMGINNRHNPVNVAIAVALGRVFGEGALAEGIRVCVSSYTRHHVNVMMTKAKVVGNYANSQLAKMEAINSGYDEAVMLDVQGTWQKGQARIFSLSDEERRLLRSRLFWKALRGIRSSIWPGTWGCRSTKASSRGMNSTSPMKHFYRHRRGTDADSRGGQPHHLAAAGLGQSPINSNRRFSGWCKGKMIPLRSG